MALRSLRRDRLRLEVFPPEDHRGTEGTPVRPVSEASAVHLVADDEDILERLQESEMNDTVMNWHQVLLHNLADAVCTKNLIRVDDAPKSAILLE